MFVVIIIRVNRKRFESQNRGYQVNQTLFSFSENASLKFKTGAQTKV